MRKNDKKPSAWRVLLSGLLMTIAGIASLFGCVCIEDYALEKLAECSQQISITAEAATKSVPQIDE